MITSYRYSEALGHESAQVGEGTTGSDKSKKERTIGDCTPQGNCGFANRPIEHGSGKDKTGGHMWELAIENACSENVGCDSLCADNLPLF